MEEKPVSTAADRVAAVTGASSGIGRAVARRLVAEGLRVAVCARRVDRLRALQQELGAPDDRFLCHPTDLRSEAEIRRFFDAVRECWGGTDVLVNCAGVGYRAPLLNSDSEPWREMLEVNVLALCICTREAVADMLRRGVAGHVVHISSLSAHRVTPDRGVYAATKFAVRALTEALRQELRGLRNAIRVTAISPGLVDTELAARHYGGEREARRARGEGVVLYAEDVAAAVWYALSCPAHVEVHDLLLRPTTQLD
jgi:17beta-estradiol 17-dehydrogenase / 3beta-hydroxysteroid 3-dehydrogenase